LGEIRLLYQLAKTMLKHRSGTLYEDMYWIDAETAKVVAKEVEGCAKSKIIYSKGTLAKIRNRRDTQRTLSEPGRKIFKYL